MAVQDGHLTLVFAGFVEDAAFDGEAVFYGHVRYDPSAPRTGTDPEGGAALYAFADPDARLVIGGAEYDAPSFEIRVGNNEPVGGVFLVDRVTVLLRSEDPAAPFELDVGYGNLTLSTLTSDALPTALPEFGAENAFGTSFFVPAVAPEPVRAVTSNFVIAEGQVGAGLSESGARFVAYLYEAAFDRNGEIDAPGLNFWIDRVEGGLSQTELADAFLAAPEFTESFGAIDTLSEADLIDRLYLNVLGRSPDGDGQAFWRMAAERPGVGKAELLIAFATGPENRAGSPFVEGLVELAPGEWEFI